MSEFSISRADVATGIVKLDVDGYLDAHTFEQMQSAIDEAFEGGIYRLLIDLEDVNYISSAGAGVFIGAIGVAQEHDGGIVFLRPTENVREVFDLLGLSLLFNFAETDEQAVATLG